MAKALSNSPMDDNSSGLPNPSKNITMAIDAENGIGSSHGGNLEMKTAITEAITPTDGGENSSTGYDSDGEESNASTITPSAFINGVAVITNEDIEEEANENVSAESERDFKIGLRTFIRHFFADRIRIFRQLAAAVAKYGVQMHTSTALGWLHHGLMSCRTTLPNGEIQHFIFDTKAVEKAALELINVAAPLWKCFALVKKETGMRGGGDSKLRSDIAKYARLSLGIFNRLGIWRKQRHTLGYEHGLVYGRDVKILHGLPYLKNAEPLFLAEPRDAVEANLKWWHRASFFNPMWKIPGTPWHKWLGNIRPDIEGEPAILSEPAVYSHPVDMEDMIPPICVKLLEMALVMIENIKESYENIRRDHVQAPGANAPPMSLAESLHHTAQLMLSLGIAFPEVLTRQTRIVSAFHMDEMPLNHTPRLDREGNIHLHFASLVAHNLQLEGTGIGDMNIAPLTAETVEKHIWLRHMFDERGGDVVDENSHF